MSKKKGIKKKDGVDGEEGGAYLHAGQGGGICIWTGGGWNSTGEE